MDTEIRPAVIPYRRQNIEHRLYIAEQALNKIRDAMLGPDRDDPLNLVDDIDKLVTNWHALT